MVPEFFLVLIGPASPTTQQPDTGNCIWQRQESFRGSEATGFHAALSGRFRVFHMEVHLRLPFQRGPTGLVAVLF
jgi:hypothetical protein